MASLLIHTCCAPCATYTVDHWREHRHQVSGYWFNPNIHPSIEHQLRLQTLMDWAQHWELPLVVSPSYGFEEYFRAVAGHESKDERCQYCYRIRLHNAANVAKEKGFDAFTTTLLISPYQNHEVLRQVGEELQGKAGIRFLYEDLRPGFGKSRTMAKEMNLYRQKYCGCLYSEAERFYGGPQQGRKRP